MKLVDKNLLKNDLRSNKLQIISSILVGIIIVVLAFVSFENVLKYDRLYNTAIVKTDYFGYILTPFVIITVLFGAILFFTSILAFNFFKTKEKVDFYNQLPVKRQTMFFTKYLATLLSSLIPYVITLLIYFIMYNILFHFSSNISTYNHDLLIAFVKVAMWGLFLYALSAFCASITGKMAGHFVVMCAIIVVPQILIQLTFVFLTMSINQGIDSTPYSDFLTKAILLGDSEYVISPLYAIIMIASTIALLFITLNIYKNYKSEDAGKFITYNWLNSFFNYLLSFTISLITISIFSGIFNTSYQYKDYYQKVMLFFVVFIIVFIISYIIIVSIKQARFTKSTINLKSMGIIALASIAFFAVAFLDIFNRSEYIPNESKVESIMFEDTEFKEPENIKLIMEMHKLAIKNEQKNIDNGNVFNEHNAEEEIIPQYYADYSWPRIEYTTKSGTLSRTYLTLIDDEFYALYEKLYSSDEYKQNTLTFIDDMINQINIETKEREEMFKNPSGQLTVSSGTGYINLMPTYNGYISEPVEDKYRIEFLEALKLDIENDDNYSKYSNQEISLYNASLDLNIPSNGFSGYNTYSYMRCDIMPSYENSMRFLEERTNLIKNNSDFTIITFKNSDDNIIKEDALSKGVHTARCVAFDEYYSEYDINGAYNELSVEDSINRIENDTRNSDIVIMNSIEDSEQVQQFLAQTRPYYSSDGYFISKLSEDKDIYRMYIVNNNDELIPLGAFTK